MLCLSVSCFVSNKRQNTEPMGPNCMCGTSHDPRNRFTDDQIFEKLPLTKFNFIKFAKFFFKFLQFFVLFLVYN